MIDAFSVSSIEGSLCMFRHQEQVKGYQCCLCLQARRLCRDVLSGEIQSVQRVSRRNAEFHQDPPADGGGRSLHRKPPVVPQNDGSVSAQVKGHIQTHELCMEMIVKYVFCGHTSDS